MEIIKYSKRVFSGKDLQKLSKYDKNNLELDIHIPGQNDSHGCACYLAAYHHTTYTNHIGTVIFIVQSMISRLNKNPNACSGRSKQPGYRYGMVKRRRQLLRKGYRFDRKTREWVKR